MTTSKELTKVIHDRVFDELRKSSQASGGGVVGTTGEFVLQKPEKLADLQTPLAKARRIVKTKDQLNAGQMRSGISGPLTETTEAARLYYAKKPFKLGISGLFFVSAQSIKQMSFLDAQSSPLDIAFKETTFNA